jgi:hypothetical protein
MARVDEAARRHEAGESVAALADEYDVTVTAVYQAIRRLNDPALKAAENATRKAARTTACETCGGPAMKLIGSKLRHNRDGHVLCASCRNKTRRERFRFDETGALIAVRCSSVDCANGDRWQPPEHFAGHTNHRDIRPKGVHGLCRACNTVQRKRYRQEHREHERAYDRERRRRQRAAA